MIDINEYLDELPRTKESEKNGDTELKEIMLNSIPNEWNKQAHV